MTAGRFEATVTAVRPLAPAVRAVELAVHAEPPLRHAAGQYVRVHLADGRRRDLSMADPCAGDNRIELRVRHAGGPFTGHVFGAPAMVDAVLPVLRARHVPGCHPRRRLHPGRPRPRPGPGRRVIPAAGVQYRPRAGKHRIAARGARIEARAAETRPMETRPGPIAGTSSRP